MCSWHPRRCGSTVSTARRACSSSCPIASCALPSSPEAPLGCTSGASLGARAGTRGTGLEEGRSRRLGVDGASCCGCCAAASAGSGPTTPADFRCRVGSGRPCSSGPAGLGLAGAPLLSGSTARCVVSCSAASGSAVTRPAPASVAGAASGGWARRWRRRHHARLRPSPGPSASSPSPALLCWCQGFQLGLVGRCTGSQRSLSSPVRSRLRSGTSTLCSGQQHGRRKPALIS